MAKGIDRFTREQFEEALAAALPWKSVTPLGLKEGEYTYRCDFGSPFVVLEVRSSVDSSGRARDCGDDSIRAWGVRTTDDKPIGAKVQTYVMRTTNWRTNLARMLRQMIRLALWVQPCPRCQQMMRLAVKKADKEAFLFCPHDAEHRNDPGYTRHVKFTVIDWNTGAELNDDAPPPPPAPTATPQAAKPDDAPTCPRCGIPLRRVRISRGPNAGKEAWSCPAKENGKFLNHVFTVIEDS